MSNHREAIRVTDINATFHDVILALADNNPGAITVLAELVKRDPLLALHLDGSHLYGHHIWEVYKDICGEDLERFLYHLQMELPCQICGELGITGPYYGQLTDEERNDHFTTRSFSKGKRDQYWATENPPTTPYYQYPIKIGLDGKIISQVEESETDTEVAKYQNIKVQVVAGDITQFESEALITAVNSAGLWYGAIDMAIQRIAGNMFHSQAAGVNTLYDGKVIVTLSEGRPHGGKFDNVIFVVDDLQRPLRKVILDGLLAADLEGFTSVTLPTIRMGVMVGQVEKSLDQAIGEMAEGVKEFLPQSLGHLKSITFVVYDDPPTELLLRTAIEHMLDKIQK